MLDPGVLVASAFAAAVRREGHDPDPALRLLGWLDSQAVSEGTTGVPADPHDLGLLHERLVTGVERARRGAYYTPRWLADDLVARAFRAADPMCGPGQPTVADPSCGGGVFLLAAADHLVATGSAGDVVRSLWGCDVDPLAVAVTEAALWWWSARRHDPTVAGHRIVVGDALTETSLPAAHVVVGNPPFLGQLRRATAADASRRVDLRRRFGGALRPYTDPAWLFLLAAVDAVRPGGAVALVQPSSLLGARDGGAVRDRIDARATMVESWVDDGSAFEASVEACAPVLRVGEPAANDWSEALSAARGTPKPRLRSTSTVADVADVVAGFRDEYYGLVDAVREGGDGPRLVTSGAIDPLRVRSDVTTRFAKHRWTYPTVDVAGLGGRAGRWVACQARPKLLVATQTRVVEAAVDEDGRLIGSVPVIVVMPRDPRRLWHLAAALHAPAVSAWMMRRSAGTALSNDACKPTAKLVSEIPIPVDDAAWDRAADLARAIAGGDDPWEDFAVAADRAHGVDDHQLRGWWLRRLPVR